MLPKDRAYGVLWPQTDCCGKENQCSAQAENSQLGATEKRGVYASKQPSNKAPGYNAIKKATNTNQSLRRVQLRMVSVQGGVGGLSQTDSSFNPTFASQPCDVVTDVHGTAM